MVEFLLIEELLEALDEILETGNIEDVKEIETFFQARFKKNGTLAFKREDLEDD